MTDPTKDQIAAAVSTPIRDLRDEVWVRVYAAEFSKLLAEQMMLAQIAERAGHRADRAVEFLPIPAHRRAEGGLS